MDGILLNKYLIWMKTSLFRKMAKATKTTRPALGRVSKRSKHPLSRTRSTSTSNTPAALAQSENISDAESEASFAASDHEELSDAGSSPDDNRSRPTQHAEHKPFSAAQLSVIRDTAVYNPPAVYSPPGFPFHGGRFHHPYVSTFQAHTPQARFQAAPPHRPLSIPPGPSAAAGA